MIASMIQRHLYLPLLPVGVHKLCRKVHVHVKKSLPNLKVTIFFLATIVEHAQMGHLKIEI